MSYILIVGAKSDIAKAVAREYSKNGYDIYLAGRKINELEDFANDIRVRGVRNVKLLELDITNFSSHEEFYNNIEEKPLGVISAVGYLGEQKLAEKDFSETLNIINANYTGVISLFNIIADDFEDRKNGFMVGISSVAGERGRKSNYMYGSAKAGLTAYLSGLRNRLYESQVHVMTVNPGFVATKMTEGMDLPEKLTASPKDVAEDIFESQQKRKSILYTKWIWQYIMMIIKLIPEWQFRKMSI